MSFFLEQVPLFDKLIMEQVKPMDGWLGKKPRQKPEPVITAIRRARRIARKQGLTLPI